MNTCCSDGVDVLTGGVPDDDDDPPPFNLDTMVSVELCGWSTVAVVVPRLLRVVCTVCAEPPEDTRVEVAEESPLVLLVLEERSVSSSIVRYVWYLRELNTLRNRIKQMT